jgi:hypothetical protein
MKTNDCICKFTRQCPARRALRVLAVLAVFAISQSATAVAAPVIDDSPTRVQTTLKVDMTPVGTLRPKSVGEISSSRWTLDCGGMDREHADWRAVREYVAPLGIARIRQQGGWARCEKDPGKYDFAWLDQVVFDAKRRGVSVWMELSYGNPAYPGGGGRQLAAGLPTSEEALAAWDRWVGEMARRYKGTVSDWCVWNEPDLGRAGNDPATVAAFAIRTAETVRREIPDATIAAFALAGARLDYVRPLVEEIARRGKAGLFDSIAYHHYAMNPDDGYGGVEECRAFLAREMPGLKLRQGEGGTWSEWGGAGALKKYPWTEISQAKYDLRRALGDLGHGDDTEVFHLCDLEYRTSGFHDGLVRYGLLKTSGQADGYRVLKVKTAYYAIQNAVSVFNDDLDCLGPEGTARIGGIKRGVAYEWRHRKSGAAVVVFWNAAGVPSDDFKTHEVEVSVAGDPAIDPVWVDLLSGNAYAIPPERIRRDGGRAVYAVPVYDSPAFIAPRRMLSLEKSWFVRHLEEGGK